MKQLLLSLCLCLLLTGCAGDTVIYQVEGGHDDEPQDTPPPVVEPMVWGRHRALPRICFPNKSGLF